MVTILRRRVAHNIWVATLKVKVTAWPCSKIVSGQQVCYLKLDFQNISHEWSPYWDDVSRTTFGLLPLRSRSQHDLAAKSCPAHNFVIWSRISKIFHRNDHHIIHDVSRATFGLLPWRSRSQHDLSAKLFPAHNFFIWSLISKIFHMNDHHIEMTCRVQHYGCYLEG